MAITFLTNEDREELEQEIPVIDTTLTQEGQAADAKATGDAISKLSEEIANLQISGGGMSQTLRTAIYNLLMDAAYLSTGHESDKAALEELLTGSSSGGESGGGEEVTYYTIEKNLTNVTINNGAASVAAGSAYSATLTADDGYILDDSDISVIMGGEAVTVTDGVIDIASVTGNIVITATATPTTETPLGVAWTEGYMLLNGEPYTNTKYVVSDYVDVSGKTEIRIHYDGTGNKTINFQIEAYDTDKNRLKDYAVNTYLRSESDPEYPSPLVYPIQTGTAYVRMATSIKNGSDSAGYVYYTDLTYELI